MVTSLRRDSPYLCEGDDLSTPVKEMRPVDQTDGRCVKGINPPSLG